MNNKAVAEEAASVATARTAVVTEALPPKRGQPVELGTINYVNLTRDGRHGDYEATLQAAAVSGKPIFANFVEWSG